MERISFSTGQSFRLDGEHVEVIRSLQPDRVQLEHHLTGEIVTEHIGDLLECYADGRLVATDLYGKEIASEKRIAPLAVSLKPRDRHEVQMKLDILTHLRREVGAKLTRKNIKESYNKAKEWIANRVKKAADAINAELIAHAAQKKQRKADDAEDVPAPKLSLGVPSEETVYSWHRVQRKAEGDPNALVPRHADKGSRAPRLSQETRELMDQLIRDRYLTQARMTMRHVHQLLMADIVKRNQDLPADSQIRAPSYTAFRDRIRSYSVFEVYARRYGGEAARRKFSHRGVGEVTTRIQQRYEVDHMRLDVIVIDRKWRIPLGRPWITAIIDRHSRMIVGYHIGFQTPNVYSVLRALKSAVLPKNKLLRRIAEVAGSWPCWGLFEELVCDNGLELHAGALRRAALELGITLTFCGARDPQGKGTIERFFRTLTIQFIQLLPGTTRSNTKDRGEVNPAEEARIDLEDLEKTFLKYIVDVYMRQPHEGLADTPINVWDESAKHHPPYLPGDAERVRLSLAVTRTLPLTEKGVTFDGLQFNSPELNKMRRSAALKLGPSPEVIVKIDPDDLMHIHVAFKGKAYVKVPHVSPEYAEGLTMDQHMAIRRHDRQRVNESNVMTLLESKGQLQAMVDALYDKPKAGKATVTKVALKEALKSVNAFKPSGSGEAGAVAGSRSPSAKGVPSMVKTIGTYLSRMFASPYDDDEAKDYDVSFSAPTARDSARDAQ